MATRMLQRRGTAAEWAAANPILGDGEIGIERNTGIVKVGDGTTAWASLVNVYKRASEYVARAGDTMTGPLRIERANGGLDAIQLRNADSGLMFYLRTRVGGGMEFVNNAYSAVVASISDAGALVANTLTGTNGVYDGANRVYSAGNVPPYPNAFAVIDAVGDILVGTGDNAAGRLAKGANNSIMVVNSAGTVTWLVKGSNGQVLTIDGSGNLSWATPAAADLSTRVAKTGDTMTGTLILSNTGGTSPLRLISDGISRYFRVAANGDLEFINGAHTNVVARISDTGVVSGAQVLDNGNRVYSASNPPPESGMKVLAGTSMLDPVAASASAYDGSYYYEPLGQDFTFVAPASGKVKVTQSVSLTNGQTGFSWKLSGESAAKTVFWPRHSGNSVPYGSNQTVAYIGGLTPGSTYTLQPYGYGSNSFGNGQTMSGFAATYTVEG